MSAAKESIQDRLRMTHLNADIEELKKSVEETVRPPPVDEKDPRDEETWTFAFDHTDKRGKRWAGELTNAILTLEEQGYVAVLRSRLQGGQPTESLDSSVVELNMAISWLSYSLKKKPEWAKDLLSLRDPAIVFALWERVRSHEDRYFRRGTDTTES